MKKNPRTIGTLSGEMAQSISKTMLAHSQTELKT